MTKKALVASIAVAVVSFSLGLPLENASAQLVQSIVTVVIVPDAPSNLTAVPTSPNEVDLTWTDNSDNEDGFSVERKVGVAGTYAEIAETGPNIATYVDNAVSPATTYFYRVRAFAGQAFSDYSDEASVTTPAPSSGGGGGGGGSGGSGGSNGGGSSGGGGNSGGGGGGGGGYAPAAPSAPATSVVISGSAYPLSNVTILKDGQIAVQTIAGPDANFSVTVNGLTGGSYVFSVYGQDSAGRRSATFTFPVTITTGVTTLISGVFLSPTIDIDKQEVKKGDTITIFGQAVPSAKISIEVDSAQPVFESTNANQSGAYLYEFDTSPLELGSHVAKSKAATGTVISSYSISQGFTVGTENIAAVSSTVARLLKGDLNGDGRVNLIDFSILAYWYGKPNPPPAYNLKGTGSTITLVDFSIMAYYWTG